MSDAELRKQTRYTWMLIAFTAIMFVLMAHQSRATAQADDASRHAGEPVAGVMIETGSDFR